MRGIVDKLDIVDQTFNNRLQFNVITCAIKCMLSIKDFGYKNVGVAKHSSDF